jgi:FkbH-like protein
MCVAPIAPEGGPDIPAGGNPSAVTPRTRRRLAAWMRSRRPEILAAWLASHFDSDRLRRFGVAGAEAGTRDGLAGQFLGPLYDLLTAYAQTGEDRYRDVYLDERLRYAPHRASPAVRAEFFREVLGRDEESFLAGAPRQLAPVLHSFLTDVHAPLRHPPPGNPLRLLTLGDCLMTELRAVLQGQCRRSGLALDMRQLYFSALTGRSLSAGQVVEFLKEFPADLIALGFLSYSGIPPYSALLQGAGRLRAADLARGVAGIVRVIREFLERLREHTGAPFLVHNASGLPLTRYRKHVPLLAPLSPGRRRVVRALNETLAELLANTPKAIIIDERAAAAARGYRRCAAGLIPRRIAHGASFHTTRFSSFLAPVYLDVLRSYRALGRAKVLLVDFDNTLWHGVMADGPVRHRHDLQALLRRLKDSGLLLVAVSKNDAANIRWHEMTLRPDDFVLQKISWDLKVQSIRKTAHELDLGLDSFVLLDDNPAEREFVRTQLPMVLCLDPNAPHALPWLERLLGFPNTQQTEEARRRTELYRQQVRRREALDPQLDYTAMMASLGLAVTFRRAALSDLDRLAELVQRTNQFNTTTVRYTKEGLRALLGENKARVYVATVADKFGGMGLACAAVVERRGKDRVVASFVMSCRAMGFGLERLMLRLVLDAEAPGADRFVGRFIPTDRNTPARDLFAESGFARSGETDWVLEAGAARPEKPTWFKVEAA